MESLKEAVEAGLKEVRKIKDAMKFGEYVLEVARKNPNSKNFCEVLFEALVKEDLQFYRNILCLYFYTKNGLNKKNNKHYFAMKDIAEREIEMYKEEIELANFDVVNQYNAIITNKRKNDFLKAVKNNPNLYNDEDVKKKYDRITSKYYEARVNVNKKIINFVMACLGRTELQQYEAGLITKKDYNNVVNEIYPLVEKIAKRYNIIIKPILITKEQSV